MPRPSRPWFRSAKNTWYVTVDGKKVSLGVIGEANEANALTAWHKLMAGGGPAPKPKAKPTAPTVRAIIDAFLADAQERVSPECHRQYSKHLLRFAKRYGSRPADRLTVADAESYVRRPEWSASYRNGVLGSLVSAYRWAMRSGLLTSNPLQGVRKPPKVSRGAKALIQGGGNVIHVCRCVGSLTVSPR